MRNLNENQNALIGIIIAAILFLVVFVIMIFTIGMDQILILLGFVIIICVLLVILKFRGR